MNKLKNLNVPNIITTFRLFLIPLFVWQFIKGNYTNAAVIYIVAWISDVVDGYIARKYKLVTDFGKFFDPLADKLMSITALVCLWYKGFIVWHIPTIILVKEILLGIGGLFLFKKLDKVDSANWAGKVATFLFTVAIVLLLFEETKDIGSILIWIAVASSIVALFVYIKKFYNHIKKAKGVS